MYHIAQLNTSRARTSLEDPSMSRFVEWLEPINGLADESPGLVWRLQTEEGNATSIRLFDDPMIIPNVSVWESLGALRAFVRHPNHVQVMRESSKWFVPIDGPHLVLWWVSVGHRPTPSEARERLEHLAARGPTSRAFTFAHPYPVPES